jgi:SAM-dependent methyltransferase
VTRAVYDPHADWYAWYVQRPEATGTRRASAMLQELLGPGNGRRCLDIGCGTGVHASAIRECGWRVFGIDISLGQLRHAKGVLPVVAADAAALPLPSASVDAVVGAYVHTDIVDWSVAVREAVRVLRPGGRFVYVGVHPCFVGPFAERDETGVRLHDGYHERRLTFRGPGINEGIRSRVGVRHRTLADLLNAIADAGLSLRRVLETGAESTPNLLGLAAVKAWQSPVGHVSVRPASPSHGDRA